MVKEATPIQVLWLLAVSDTLMMKMKVINIIMMVIKNLVVMVKMNMMMKVRFDRSGSRVHLQHVASRGSRVGVYPRPDPFTMTTHWAGVT